MKVGETNQTSHRRISTQRLTDGQIIDINALLDDGQKPEAMRLASSLGLVFTDENFQEIIANRMAEINMSKGVEAYGTLIERPEIRRDLHRSRSTMRYTDHIESLNNQWQYHGPESILEQPSQLSESLEKDRDKPLTEDQFLREISGRVFDSDMIEFQNGQGRVVDLFLWNDGQPITVRIYIFKNNHASRAKKNVNQNYSARLYIKDTRTGENYYKIDLNSLVDPKFLDEDRELYNFNPIYIARELLKKPGFAKNRFSLKNYKPEEPLLSVGLSFIFDDLNVYHGLQELSGDELFDVISKLDLCADLQKLVESGDLKKIFETAHTESFEFNDGTCGKFVRESVSARLNPFRGKSRR